MNSQGRLFRAAIFDLDGLLVDSEPLWQQAEIECFGEVGIALTRAQAQETLGLRSDEVVQRRFDEYGWNRSEHPLATVEARIVRRVVELLRETTPPMPGALAALDFVEERGLRLGLASSSRLAVIEAALTGLGLQNRFAVVHSGEQEPLGKPHPGVYLTTARRLGLSPASCIAFEDSTAGLKAAKAAGMACVLVPDRSLSHQPDVRRADLVLGSLAELDAAVWRQLFEQTATEARSRNSQ